MEYNTSYLRICLIYSDSSLFFQSRIDIGEFTLEKFQLIWLRQKFEAKVRKPI